MTDLILPTDEQVERACALVAKGVDRVWPEDVAVHEHISWRASCRSTLLILLNQDKILGEPAPLADETPHKGTISADAQANAFR